MRRIALAMTLLVLVACSSSKTASVLIIVNVPLARDPALSQQIVRGTQLAVDEANAKGGVQVGAEKRHLAVVVLDSEGSPTKTAANYREAIRRGAVAVIDEGTGVDAAWPVAAAADLPICIVYQGGTTLVDPVKRPNVFRIAPTDRGAAFRLSEYLVPKGLRIAILHDDSTYGNGGRAALDFALSQSRSSVTAEIRVPATASELAPFVVRARDTHATALLVWARAPVLAQAIRAARAAGWNVPIYASTSGADPLVRQQLADHPEWIEGLTFTMSRLTSEKGPSFWLAFQKAYENRFGIEKIGVTSNGKQVVQLPDPAMYPYDFVRVLVAAINLAATITPLKAIVNELNIAEVFGANGDERQFNSKNHEGVVDDDIFFAKIQSMVWVPVKDDPLSATLATLEQTS